VDDQILDRDPRHVGAEKRRNLLVDAGHITGPCFPAARLVAEVERVNRRVLRVGGKEDTRCTEGQHAE
jgi:hypothetical protein